MRPAMNKLISSFALVLVLATGCGGPPSVDDLASNLCTCDEQAGGEEWDTATRTSCLNAAKAYLGQQDDACLECLDEKIGDSTAAAACSSADSCTACRDDGE